MQVHMTDEHYAILHKLICDQMDAVLSPYDNVEDYEPTPEHYAILEAVTLFSSQNPNPNNAAN